MKIPLLLVPCDAYSADLCVAKLAAKNKTIKLAMASNNFVLTSLNKMLNISVMKESKLTKLIRVIENNI